MMTAHAQLRERPADGAGAEWGLSPSADPGARLRRALAELKAQAVLPLLASAMAALEDDRQQDAGDLALQALELDETCAMVWHVLAICRERAGDFGRALQCYERALDLDPADADLANDLGRLACMMDMPAVAAELFARFLALRPASTEGANNLACALRELMRYGDALDVLRPAIQAEPTSSLLWNTLGTVIAESGEVAQAAVFYREATRLDPQAAKPRYNLANAELGMGAARAAVAHCDQALEGRIAPRERAMMRFARATMLLAAGEVGQGWDAYEARLDPHYAEVLHFLLERPGWTPDTALAGKHMLLVGEQGLGDEVLFANAVPDVISALGSGKLTLAVEPRLVSLFQRSFPSARVGAHATGLSGVHSVRAMPFLDGALETVELWAPMASPLRRFRRQVADFPADRAFLTANPARVAHWRRELSALGAGPKVGLVWKSLKINSARSRFFSPFDAWAPVLATPGVRFVNLQYGDCAAELAQAREALGVEIWSPPFNLKDELDEVAALSTALDLVIGPANASTNIAAACGAPTWLISLPGAWPLLGTDRYPWYPGARVFMPPAFNCWANVMAEVARALAGLAA